MAKLKITETVLRDSHQSLIATRMTIDEMLPILKALDEVGYYSLEAWGGATFDACLRFLNEDPWERLRTIRANVKNTKLQMLFRGQNILGYRHYADDVVEYFVQKSIANGIDIIRIFDALNDPRNLKTAIDATKKEGGHVQAAMSYTTGPVFGNEYFANYAKTLEEMGADSICIKDMAGLLKPYDAYDLVKAIKSKVKIPVQLHTHYTAGLASMTALKQLKPVLMSSIPLYLPWLWALLSRLQSRWSQPLPELRLIPGSISRSSTLSPSTSPLCVKNISQAVYWTPRS